VFHAGFHVRLPIGNRKASEVAESLSRADRADGRRQPVGGHQVEVGFHRK
jgi:hypothetical protein